VLLLWTFTLWLLLCCDIPGVLLVEKVTLFLVTEGVLFLVMFDVWCSLAFMLLLVVLTELLAVSGLEDKPGLTD
jgi:hypothetical protein